MDAASDQTDARSLCRVLQAARFAADHHARQKRWGVPTQPRITHLLEVAESVTAAGETADAICMDWVVAALLHEVVEATDVTLAELEERFGTGVAALVDELTSGKALTQAERQRVQVERAPHCSPGCQAVRLADLVVDLQSVLRQPPRDWDHELAAAHSAWAGQLVANMPASPAPLVAELGRLQHQLELFVRLARRGVDEGVHLLSVGYHQFGELGVLREWWSQDGVEGDSAVLLKDQVGDLSDEALVEWLEEHLELSIGTHTVSRTDEWVFVNWGMRQVNSMM